MKLSFLSSELGDCLIEQRGDAEIQSLNMDSRSEAKDSLFFCISGSRHDAHEFAPQAVANGACALVVERFLEDISVPQVLVRNARQAMALMAGTFYGHADREMKLLGLTGTKGKTTTSYLIKGILEHAGFKVGLIGTTGNMIGSRFLKSNLTTPDPIDLHRTLREMADSKVQLVVMEVSAHALAMNRLSGIRFETGCYTNLSQDHLDYFGTMEKYFECKKGFFTRGWLNNAALNVDDETTQKIIDFTDVPFTRFGIAQNADVAARNIEISENGVQFNLIVLGRESYPVDLKLTGMFNVYNALAASAVCLNLGLEPDVIARGIGKVRSVPGRAQVLETHTPYKVVLDYSHSPDALENILTSTREFVRGRIICVFGCGGDRDKQKRPIMGEIGGKLADFCILTSDNPRTENPFDILASVEKGIKKTGGEYIVIENRRQAIRHALQMGREGDIIILAGKGHETYQEIMGVKRPFDEKIVVGELLEELKETEQ